MTTVSPPGPGSPGAIESNAGDDYHILWACRCCLRLLDPDAGLTFVVVEGVSQEDVSNAADADAFLGVDLTEYFGGTSLEDADRVVLSQLKYSQRHPDRPWTAARLCERHNGSADRSIIGRLAQAFSGFLANNNRASVLHRLSIKLVSNRPADEKLLAALRAAQSWLTSRGADLAVKTGQMLRSLPVDHKDNLQRLQGASGLSSCDFSDFLRCLDLSGCSSDGRLWQRLRLIQEVGRVAASPTEKARGLYELVAAEALPKATLPGLRSEDVLTALGCHRKEDLFPAQPEFQAVPDPIPTPDAGRLAVALQGSASRRLLAHGAGGVGKTTAVLQMGDCWPKARFLLYDCFGGGNYLDIPGDERHSPRRALVQMSTWRTSFRTMWRPL